MSIKKCIKYISPIISFTYISFDSTIIFRLQLYMIAYIFLSLGVVFLIIYLIKNTKCKPKQPLIVSKAEPEQKNKVAYGRLRIYYGTQTGTAAKLSQQLAEQGTEHGFEPQVINLKDLTISHFESTNEISLFLLSNTGEGDPPENTVNFVKVLKGKQSLHEVKNVDWKKVNFSIFGLGNTQYEHYNKTAKDADSLLEKNGAKRIYELGLGDDNSSLEDDYLQWRKRLWSTLKKFRQSNPLQKADNEQKALRKKSSEQVNSINYLSKLEPVYANYKLFIKKGEEGYHWHQQDFDFKTKASLKAHAAKINNIKQLRQNLNDGSTLQIEIELPNQPQYQTAGNIAIYSKNDPTIIEEVVDYFNIQKADLDKKISLTKIKQQKKLKLNFIPDTIRALLTESIDIQGKITKSVLKKLATFQSTNPKYFSQNSLKTTKEFERITDEKEWYYLIRLIKQFEVKLSFQDFIQLSDSMAPRLFTIASHALTQKNVIAAASIVQNGLISKYFQSKPQFLKAELRKSAFTDAMHWKKVIFIAAGTGLAPFRAYIQQKIYNLKQKQEGKDINVPIITLIFGCKHQVGDFIYKQQIMSWKQQNIINRLHLAFSRDTQKKVYVQDVLKKQEEEVKELGHCDDTAVYICGSLPMGKSIVQVLSEALGEAKVKQMQEKGRIVKQLW